MMEHEIHKDTAKIQIKVVGEQIGCFDKEADLYESFTDSSAEESIIDQVRELIKLIKVINTATYIGTIQTTSELNRISQSIPITTVVLKHKNWLENFNKQCINIKKKNITSPRIVNKIRTPKKKTMKMRFRGGGKRTKKNNK
mgnify:CR=1 FL=1